MYVVIRTLARSPRSALGLSLSAFASVGAIEHAGRTVADGVPPVAVTTAAVVVAVAGVYGLALFARTVSRRRLATVALSLWTAFLAVAAVYAADLATGVATTVLLESGTRLTLLGAGVSTAFLAFREYGSRTAAGSPEDRVLESDADV